MSFSQNRPQEVWLAAVDDGLCPLCETRAEQVLQLKRDYVGAIVAVLEAWKQNRMYPKLEDLMKFARENYTTRAQKAQLAKKTAERLIVLENLEHHKKLADTFADREQSLAKNFPERFARLGGDWKKPLRWLLE